MMISKNYLGKTILGQLQRETLDCKRCKEEAIRQGPVIGVGYEFAELMLIGQNSCYPRCLKDQIPFSGGSGYLLDRALSVCNLSREEVFITNTVKCATINNTYPTATMIKNCDFLFREIETLQPKKIISLGKLAAERLLCKGLNKKQEVYLNFKRYIVHPLYHPAFYTRRGDSLKFIELFQQAIRE